MLQTVLQPPPFPIRVEDLTSDLLSEALGATVESFSHTRIGAERGMLGEIFLVTPTYAGDSSGPESVIAKFAALREGALASARRSKSHERELRCYVELLSDTPVNTPKFYGAWLDPDTAHFLLLQAAIDVDEQVDQVAGLTVEQAKSVLDQAASLHARWWQHPDLAEATWLPRADGEHRVHNLTTLCQTGMPLLTQMLGDELDEEDLQICAAHTARLPLMLQRIAEQPSTFVHSDMRADNLLFSPADGQVTLVDWQGAGVGPPAFDIAYFFAQSLTVETRRSHEDALLDYYQAALHDRGVTLSNTEIRAGYAETFSYSLTIACALPVISDPTEPRVRKLALAIARRSLEGIKDHQDGYTA